ncbi:Aspartyl-tRNA(Asn) amidotransferase subunit C @ Glutamyl-tRNA(Gln) amidotransferase subunit C [hydrothermal vent metagenome]|uniref:Aspartyl-tRNA(Asn) amidotransferase subunit C @ Glutamyl-tRNA(Gln) amidotransferase subunit C n=1 Tax=hydrothermal vent metagenome TaxID=652676 RepID=A0A3B1DQR4_9ZZZZ
MSLQLTRNQVAHVATLSRLSLTDTELDTFTHQLQDILEYIEMLEEVDTENTEPMVHAIEQQNVFREDELADSLPRDEALKNAPATDGSYFLVPPILETE